MAQQRGVRRGPGAGPNPASQSSRALAVLTSAPGSARSTQELADGLAIPGDDYAARHRLGATLATRWRTAAAGTDWRRVHRTPDGGWVFLPELPERPPRSSDVRSSGQAPPGFVEVTRNGETVVLADGAGRLWVATPLSS